MDVYEYLLFSAKIKFKYINQIDDIRKNSNNKDNNDDNEMNKKWTKSNNYYQTSADAMMNKQYNYFHFNLVN